MVRRHERIALSCAAAVSVSVSVSAWTPAAGLRKEVLSLLTQRSVQTQVYYHASFHDEVKANWISKFHEPVVTMGTERARTAAFFLFDARAGRAFVF